MPNGKRRNKASSPLLTMSDPREGTSNKPVTTDSQNERVPGLKRKESWDGPEDTLRDNKRQRTESSDSSASGPSTSTRPRRQASKKMLHTPKQAQGHSSKDCPESVPKKTHISDSSESSVYVDSGEEKYSASKEFHLKYSIISELAEGGFGTVYSAIRRVDKYPVAVKRVPSWTVTRTKVMLNGEMTVVPQEVALLIKVGALESNNVTPVLLDWYDCDSEIVLVLERPEPCLDLEDYVKNMGGFLNEYEAKLIFRQLVDAALQIRDAGVFHRDIKPRNILIETGHDRPRARVIDFGCGFTCSPGEVFHRRGGTLYYTPPEFFSRNIIQADSTTVWQLGVTLYCMLNQKLPFASEESICSSNKLRMKAGLSENAKDFLRKMLDKNPETRLSIQALKDHPWMK